MNLLLLTLIKAYANAKNYAKATSDTNNTNISKLLNKEQSSIIANYADRMGEVIKKFQETLPENKRLSDIDIDRIKFIIFYALEYEVSLGAGGHVTDLATIISSALNDIYYQHPENDDIRYNKYIQCILQSSESSEFLRRQKGQENNGFIDVYKKIPYVGCFIKRDTDGKITLKASIGGKEIYSDENGTVIEPHKFEKIKLVSQYYQNNYERSVASNESGLFESWKKEHPDGEIFSYGD